MKHKILNDGLKATINWIKVHWITPQLLVIHVDTKEKRVDATASMSNYELVISFGSYEFTHIYIQPSNKKERKIFEEGVPLRYNTKYGVIYYIVPRISVEHEETASWLYCKEED